MSHHHKHSVDRFESRQEPLAPRDIFLKRLARSIVFGLFFVVVALGVGILGYHVTGGLGWLDSFYNAAMILGGMGPVDGRPVIPAAEKWFASCYALFAGVAFLVIAGVMFAPLFHRALHRFHLTSDEDAST